MWKWSDDKVLTACVGVLQVSGGVLYLWQRGQRGGALCQHHQEEADAARGSVWGGGAAGGAGGGQTVYTPSSLRPHLCHSGLPGLGPPAHPAALHLRPAAGGVHRQRWGGLLRVRGLFRFSPSHSTKRAICPRLHHQSTAPLWCGLIS